MLRERIESDFRSAAVSFFTIFDDLTLGPPIARPSPLGNHLRGAEMASLCDFLLEAVDDRFMDA